MANDEHVHDENCDHNHEEAPVANPGNPFGNLDEDTQRKIQELQMLEQSFQQLLMQKNAFSSESTETDYIITEVNKSEGEISRIIGNQIVIKSTKEKIIEDMENKKKLLNTRMKTIDKQEKEFSEKIESIRDEVMKKIQ